MWSGQICCNFNIFFKCHNYRYFFQIMKFFIKCFSFFSQWAHSPINALPLLADSETYKEVSDKEMETGLLSSDENVPYNRVCIFRAPWLWGHITSQCAIYRILKSFIHEGFFQEQECRQQASLFPLDIARWQLKDVAWPAARKILLAEVTWRSWGTRRETLALGSEGDMRRKGWGCSWSQPSAGEAVKHLDQPWVCNRKVVAPYQETAI